MNVCVPPIGAAATVLFMAALVSMFILGFLVAGAVHALDKDG